MRRYLPLVVLLLSACAPSTGTPDGADTAAQASVSSSPAVIRGADLGRELPLKFWDVQEAMAQPTERPTEPFPCMSAFFTPERDLPMLTEDGSAQVRFGKVIVDVVRTTIRDLYDDSLAPYEIIEYRLKDPFGDCRTAAIQVQKEGKQFALYTHIYENMEGYPEWRINPVSEQLIVHSRRIQDGKWVEQVRRIDLKTKEAQVFPLDPCYIGAYAQNDGGLAGGYGDMSQEGASVYCYMTATGALLAKVNAVGVGGSTLLFDGFNAEQRLFYFADISSNVTKLNLQSSVFVVQNADDPQQWAVFPVMLPTTICDDAEVDLSSFSFERPVLRYRMPLYETVNHESCARKTGMGDWIALQ